MAFGGAKKRARARRPAGSRALDGLDAPALHVEARAVQPPGAREAVPDYAVLAAALDPIVTIDSYGTIRSASDSVERVFGWLPSELIGQNVHRLMPAPHGAAHDNYLEAYRRSGRTHILGGTREFEGVRKSGERFPLELSVSRLDPGHGGLPLFVGIVRDISDRKRLELELRLVQDLALGVSTARDLSAAFEETLKQICLATAWDYGEVWTPSPAGDALVAVASWARPGSGLERFAITLQTTRFERGCGLVGRAWESRKPYWVGDLSTLKGPEFRRPALAMTMGLRAALSVPILSDDGLIATLLFYVRQTRAEDLRLVELVRAASAPLGSLIQHKRTEEALRESEQRFRLALDAAGAGAWSWNVTEDDAWWSSEMYRLWGVEPATRMRLENSVALIEPEDVPRVREAVARVLAEHEDYQSEFRVRHPEHGVRWMASYGRVVRDEAGRPVRMFGFTRDVTERRRAEEELRLREEQMRAAFELAAVGQCQVDLATHRFVRVNTKLCEITGYSESELLGMTFSDLTHPDERQNDLERFTEAVESGGRGYIVEKRYVKRDGGDIWVRVSVAILRDRSERPYRTVAMIEDITDRRRTEELGATHAAELERLVAERTRELERSHESLRMADRLASIGSLAAGLGHDMNNVLLPVRAHLNALRAPRRDEALASSDLKHVDAIRKSIAYLQQLADGLHFLAADPERGGDGSIGLSRWWLQAGPIISKAVPKHVRVIASIPHELPPVAIPASGLTQAVLNLVVNAGESMPSPTERKRRQGLVRVWARLQDPGAPIPRVILGVTDNGQGMTEDVRRRACEMFFTTKPRGLGTGLGLALVRKVSDAAGADLDIQSSLGVGTTVTITIPAAVSAGSSDGDSQSAFVSVADGRAAALISQIFAASRIRVGSERSDADLWVLEPNADHLPDAQAWCAADPSRRLVLFGPPDRGQSRAWAVLRPSIIQDPTDFTALRAALGAVMSPV